jgi:AcrR family transcriptional regulator
MPRPSARARILDCAEQLFAEHGVAGVSLRAINAEAELSPAALHYHFGTKQLLVEALLDRRMSELMERRQQILDDLEAEPTPPSAGRVIGALIDPLAEFLARENEAGPRYLRFLARLRADGDLDEAYVLSHYRSGVQRIDPLLQNALPDLPVALVRLRLALAVELILPALADWGALAQAGQLDSSALSLEAYVAQLTDFIAGALDAPVHDPSPSTRAPLTLTTELGDES